jgi:hypothetical protein
MEALNAIYRLADACELFTSLLAPSIQYKLSLYADDFTIIRAIMDTFTEVSGLRTNVNK